MKATIAAYDIQPGRKTNHTNYRYAKLTVRKLQNLKLIKLVKLRKAKKKRKHVSKKYSLTDHGVFFLINNAKPFRTGLLMGLFKNYHNLNLFRFLVYPFMNMETLCSPKFDVPFLAGMKKHLVNSIEKMDHILSLIEKKDRSDKEICIWIHNKLEHYLKKTFHYEFIDYLYSEEDFDDRYQKITYFDNKNKNNYVTINYDKKTKKAYIYRKDKKIRKYEIPFAADYLIRYVVPYRVDIARTFHAFCGPKVEEFVMSVFPFFKGPSESNILDLIATDGQFRDALKATKRTFDIWYDRIMSFPNFSF